MKLRIPDEMNPYCEQTPFDVLGVAPTATAREIVAAYEELKEDINATSPDEGSRIEKLRQLDHAAEQLREAKSRIGVEIFMFDPTLADDNCKRAAEKHKKLSFEFARILQRGSDVLPNQPEMDVNRNAQPIKLKTSLCLQTRGCGVDVPPQTEALHSITFDT